MTLHEEILARVHDKRALRAIQNTSRHGTRVTDIMFDYSGRLGGADDGEVWKDWYSVPGYSSSMVTSHYWNSAEEVIAWIDANQEKAPAGLAVESVP